MPTVYINKDPATRAVDILSTKVCSILFQLYYCMNNKNICGKKKLQERMYWIKDKRSWNKYWEELVDKEIIIYLDQDTFMVSPHQCYREGTSHTALVEEWGKLKCS